MSDGVPADLVELATKWLSFAAELRTDHSVRVTLGAIGADARAEAVEECTRELLALVLEQVS